MRDERHGDDATLRLLEGLDHGEVRRGAWDGDFLTLGGRLRELFGGEVGLDARAEPAYVLLAQRVRVGVRRFDDDPALTTVRVRAQLRAPGADHSLMEFALRESTRLRLSHLAYDDAGLWVAADLPFAAGVGRFLHDTVMDVARAARMLHRDLAVLAPRR